jgi:L-asparagine transporter-like permease
MNPTISIVLPIIMVVVGLIVYFMGTRPRGSSLDVPVITNHGKMMLGGTIVFAGLLVGAFLLLRYLR